MEFTKKHIDELLSDRRELVYEKLEKDENYVALSKSLAISDEMVSAYYLQFEEDVRKKIEQHYITQMKIDNMVMNQIYLQGIQDAFHILMFLIGFFDPVKI